MVVVKCQLVINTKTWNSSKPHLCATKLMMLEGLEHLIRAKSLPNAMPRWAILEVKTKATLKGVTYSGHPGDAHFEYSTKANWILS